MQEEKYDHNTIELKWQKCWEEKGLHRAEDFSKKPKFYCLDMFPYPSAAGLHIGHPEGYTATDIYCRYLRMNGYNVLHPMGWDAFGLPAENYAIQTGTHPAKTTQENIKNMKRQIKSFGFSYDWSREIDTTDPNYYKWTQWIFLKLFEKGLAYEAIVPINWCPSCKTGLANEEVEGGKCTRCQTAVTKKDMRQWMLKITAYAERLLKDLDDLDWPESIKLLQRNWIGKSKGVEINFKGIKYEPANGIKEEREYDIPVFTTRIDTIYGVTFIVLAPEHPLVDELTTPDNKKEVQDYIEKTKNKSDVERISLEKEKSGVFIGSYAINPFNNKKVPIFIADYVLLNYGTGAVMGVPAHDQRDFDFAKKYGLDIIEVIAPTFRSEAAAMMTKAYEGPGYLINSEEFNGLTSNEAQEKLADYIESKGWGRRQINYKLRDWVFSRQRYWGEPIPLVFCENCANRIKNQKSKIKNNEFSKGELLNPGWIALPEEQLPLELPPVEKYQPTGTGESPLANILQWVNTTCPKCGRPAKRETNTMPQWAGSSWYFLRFIDPNNNQTLADFEKLKYWLPVDLYVGGAEHAVLHLLYARFWHKFLCDIGAVPKVKLPSGKLSDEPFYKLRNQGMILGEDGQKMSKSRGNVINPDEMIKQYGADTVRMYEMFMGPLEATKPWSTKGIIGIRRFLEKVWRMYFKIQNSKPKTQIQKYLIHKTIKKVTEDIENLKFNTAISALMILANELEKQENISPSDFQIFLLLLSPFAPHLAEELWEKMGYKTSIFEEKWPKYDEKLIREEKIILIIQVNGKVRDKIEVDAAASEEEIKTLAQKSEKIQKFVAGKKIKNIIFVPKRLVNIVVD